MISVPHRFDLPKNSDTNNGINLHNNKLLNLSKTFNYVSIIEPVRNSFLFTNHGLHLRGIGKELLSKQISLCIHSMLRKPLSNPAVLKWHTNVSLGNVTSSLEYSQLLVETVQKRNKRIPVTRTDDFLWEI